MADTPLTINMTAIMEIASNEKNWNHSVTGIWGKAESREKGRQALEGYLFLMEDEDGGVTGVATTMNSTWAGSVADGRLVAEYTNLHGRRGQVTLTLSEDGSTLSGTFKAIDGLSSQGGVYSAHRTRRPSRADAVAHIRERLGKDVVIL